MKKKGIAFEVEQFPDFLNAKHLLSLRTLFLEYETAMLSCYYYRCDTRWSVKWRTRLYSIFVFPTHGNLQATTLKGRSIIKPGEFLMLPENVPHSLEIAKNFRRTEHYVLHCFLQDRWARPLLSRFPSVIGYLPDTKTWLMALKELTCLMGHDPRAGQIRGETLIRELLTWQLTRGPGILSETPEGDPRVSVVIEQMKRNFASPTLSISDLAKSVNLTTVQFRTLFQKETNMGPKQFLQDLRMRKAVHFLDYSNMRVKEIASACGFSSDHYFHPAFRKEFRCTPSQYRIRSQNEFIPRRKVATPR